MWFEDTSCPILTSCSASSVISFPQFLLPFSTVSAKTPPHLASPHLTSPNLTFSLHIPVKSKHGAVHLKKKELYGPQLPADDLLALADLNLLAHSDRKVFYCST
jgi:hypothetical protein